MTKNHITIGLIAVALAATSNTVSAQGRGGRGGNGEQQATQQQAPAAGAAAAPRAPAPEEKGVETKHTLKIGGQDIKYTAKAGTINIKADDGTYKATFF